MKEAVKSRLKQKSIKLIVTSLLSSSSVNKYGGILKYEECSEFGNSGLQITAGQRTMSGQNWVLTGQILGLPDMLSGHLPTRSEKF